MQTIELVRALVALASIVLAMVRVRRGLSRRAQRRSIEAARPTIDEAFPEINHRYDDAVAPGVTLAGLDDPSRESAS